MKIGCVYLLETVDLDYTDVGLAIILGIEIFFEA
jgi:hypothetical protein